MPDSIDFSVTNEGQDNASILAAGRLNKLTLTLTNRSGAPLALKGGKAVSEDKAAGGPSSLYFTFGDLLDDEALGVMKVSGNGWTPYYFDRPAPVWCVALDADSTLADGHSLTFTLDKIVAPPHTMPGQLTIAYYNLGQQNGTRGLSLPSRKLSGDDNAPLSASWADSNQVAVTAPGSDPIATSLDFNITNTSRTQPLIPDGKWTSGKPVFHLWFVCAERPGYTALTTKALASKLDLKVATVTSDTWKVTPNLQDSPPYWLIEPQAQEVLGTGENASVRFTLSNIVSPLEPGTTVLYLEYANIPNYADGSVLPALTINKASVPRIVTFDARPRIAGFDESTGVSVEFSWRVENAKRITIPGVGSFGNGIDATVIEGSKAILLHEPGIFTLQPNEGPSAPIEIISLTSYLMGKRALVYQDVDVQTDGYPYTPSAKFHGNLTHSISFESGSAEYRASIAGTLSTVDDDGPGDSQLETTAVFRGSWRTTGNLVEIHDAQQGTTQLQFDGTQLTPVTASFRFWQNWGISLSVALPALAIPATAPTPARRSR